MSLPGDPYVNGDLRLQEGLVLVHGRMRERTIKLLHALLVNRRHAHERRWLVLRRLMVRQIHIMW